MVTAPTIDIDTPHFTQELMRAVSFYVSQIKKKWTPEEAYYQVCNSYGVIIADCVLDEIDEALSKAEGRSLPA